MKFHYDMSICPYRINWKRGSSRCWYVVKIKTTHHWWSKLVRIGVGRGGVWEGKGGEGQKCGKTDRQTDIVVHMEVTLPNNYLRMIIKNQNPA